jgi:hypothetical protein
MRRDLGFTWKNADVNMTVLIRKYGVHAVRVVCSRHKPLRKWGMPFELPGRNGYSYAKEPARSIGFFYYDAMLVFKSQTPEYYRNELNTVFRNRQLKNTLSVNIHYYLPKRRYYQSTHHTIPGDLVIQEHLFENVKSRITKFVLISIKVSAQDEFRNFHWIPC